MSSRFPVRKWFLAAVLLCLGTGPAMAQGIGYGVGAGGTGGGLGGLGGGTGGGGLGGGGGTGAGGANTLGSLGSSSLSGSGTPSLNAPSSGTPVASGSSVPSSSNPLRPFYMSPQSQGMALTTSGSTSGSSATSGMQAFGNPIYSGTTTATTGGTTGLRPGATGTTGATGATGNVTVGAPATPFGFSTIGMVRAPTYSTSPSPDLPIQAPPNLQLQTNLQQVLARSSSLSSRDNIAIAVNGNTVWLRGEVASERERRLAEGLVRLTPGVRQVVNELGVRGAPLPPPTP